VDLSPVLESQVRIQKDAIRMWQRWMIALVVIGLAVLLAGSLYFLLDFLKIIHASAPSAGEIVQVGGLVVSLLSVYPYREMVPRKERLATYQFLVEKLKSLDGLSSEEQGQVLTLANEAIKETWKR